MIGIDMGSKYIKVCKITNNPKKPEEISILCGMQASCEDPIDTKKTIISLIRKLKIGKYNEGCFLAIGGKEILNRDVILSKKSGKNLKNSVMLEVEQTITEDLSKMFSSFAVTKEISDTEYNVLFSAVPKEKLYSKINIVKNIKEVSLAGVTMEALALVNAFNVFGPDYKNTENIVLVNIGHQISNVVVVNNKELVFMRDVDFGGKDNTKDIAALYDISEDIAEEVKRNHDVRDNINFNMRNILKKSTALLIETIFRTIEHCITRQSIIAVDRIVITGGGSLIEGVDSFIEETLGIPTVKWNPLENEHIVGYTNKNYGYFMPVVLGLALEKESENV